MGVELPFYSKISIFRSEMKLSQQRPKITQTLFSKFRGPLLFLLIFLLDIFFSQCWILFLIKRIQHIAGCLFDGYGQKIFPKLGAYIRGDINIIFVQRILKTTELQVAFRSRKKISKIIAFYSCGHPFTLYAKSSEKLIFLTP